MLNLRGGDEGLGFHGMRGGENRFLKLGCVPPDGVARVGDNDDEPSESAVSESRFRAVEGRRGLASPPTAQFSSTGMVKTLSESTKEAKYWG